MRYMQENTVLSGDQFYEEMRAALLEFERRAHYNSPSKFRAFYSALRTLLCDVLKEPKSAERVRVVTVYILRLGATA